MMEFVRVHIRNLLIGLMSMLAVVGCNVHEFPDTYLPPEPQLVPFQLDLVFDTDMPFYEFYDYPSRASTDAADYDVRYIVNAYRSTTKAYEFTRTADATFVFTKDDVFDPDNSVIVYLEEGLYRFIVWADYVDAGTATDKFYNTEDYASISLTGDLSGGHEGCNDFRDSFTGRKDCDVLSSRAEIPNSTVIDMARPHAKIKFITTDLDKFVTRITRMKLEQAEREAASAQDGESRAEGDAAADGVADEATYTTTDGGEVADGNMGITEPDMEPDNAHPMSINLNDYRVRISYPLYCPFSFNMFTDKRGKIAEGVWFDSSLIQISETEAELGFDYVFTDPEDTKVTMKIEIYDATLPEGSENRVLARTENMHIQISRGKLTIARGEFLSALASGGTVISPGFDGEHFVGPFE